MIQNTKQTNIDMQTILSAAHTMLVDNINTKKSALEQLSHLLASAIDETPKTLLNYFLEREKLGSTSIGYGIAIPHVRIQALTQPMAAFIRLNKGIDFNAPDAEPVDLILGLIVPENEKEMHLMILSQIAGAFNQAAFREKLRQCPDETSLYQSIIQHFQA